MESDWPIFLLMFVCLSVCLGLFKRNAFITQYKENNFLCFLINALLFYFPI